MPILLFLTLTVSVFSILSGLETEDGLVSVTLIYRHGDRTPIKTYPNDPYSNASYWPVGFGQLTNTGKMQQFELGQWFRKRYNHFISDQFSKKETCIFSSDVDRTLMSAQANLAGLFPPQGNQIWNKHLDWQPIPVHTVPEMEDNILRMTKPCLKVTSLFRKLLESPEFIDIDKKNQNLYAYLTKSSGLLVKSIEDLEHLYSTLMIEKRYNYTLPKWTESVFPDTMAPWAHLSFALKCYTPELARLIGGPLLNNILDNFLKITKRKGYKFTAYSAHDTTIANILQSLQVFDYHSPPYCATIFFELRYLNDNYFVNILYKNTSTPKNIILKGCDFLCPLDKFRKILKPLLITPKQWQIECESESLLLYGTLHSTSFFIFTIVLLFIGSCILITCIKEKAARYNSI